MEGDARGERGFDWGSEFLSTPSGWRATYRHPVRALRALISIHALRVEGDLRRQLITDEWPISIHALRVEGDELLVSSAAFTGEFLSTPSGWRATDGRTANAKGGAISIHALRVEGDLILADESKRLTMKFLSTPSGWRATMQTTTSTARRSSFLSTPSGWRATKTGFPSSQDSFISIHALRVEGDGYRAFAVLCFIISIHALRVEGDFGLWE